MERIARAVELAREGGEAARPMAPAQIAYTRTRSVQVSPDRLRERHVTSGHDRTPMAQSFKRLRTQILQRMQESGWNALGIASPHDGAGKTTVALNLAVHTSMHVDWTVLLIDADLRRPGLCEALGLEPLPGLSDYIAHGAPLDELLVQPGFGRCVLLPAGTPLAGSSEALGSARMQDLAQELRSRYPDRLVLFDLPPLLEGADGIASLPCVQALLLVVEEGRTPATDVVRAAQLAGKVPILGTVLNKSRGG